MKRWRLIVVCALAVIGLGKPSLSQDDACDVLPIGRPPPFPDFFAAFSTSFGLDDELVELRDNLTDLYNGHGDCNCSIALVEDFEDFNAQCDPEAPACPVPTTTTPEPTTTTTTVMTTTTELTTPADTTTTTKPTTTTTASTTSTVKQTEPATTVRTTTTETMTTAESDTTKISYLPPSTTTMTTENVTLGTPNPVPSLEEDDDTVFRNIIIACVAGGIFALLLFIVTFCVVRLRSPPNRKISRQVSDRQPLPQNAQDLNVSAPNTPSVKSIANGYTNHGFLWPKPEGPERVYEGPFDDEQFHYNTLKAMEHPHALVTGFGESTTETLPRNHHSNNNNNGGGGSKKQKSRKRSSKYKSRSAESRYPPVGAGPGNTQSMGKYNRRSYSGGYPVHGAPPGFMANATLPRAPHSPPGFGDGRLPPPPRFITFQRDDLVDAGNAHLFARHHGNGVIPQPADGEILPPPPGFQGNSTESLGQRPLTRSQSLTTTPSAAVTPARQISIAMEELRAPVNSSLFRVDTLRSPEEQNLVEENGTLKSKSFLWACQRKSDANGNMPGDTNDETKASHDNTSSHDNMNSPDDSNSDANSSTRSSDGLTAKPDGTSVRLIGSDLTNGFLHPDDDYVAL